MFRTLIHPVLKVFLTPQEGGFHVQMSKLTLLGTPFFNIPTRELITRVELSQICQGLYDFGQTCGHKKSIKETLSKVDYGLAQLIQLLTTDVMKYLRIGYLLDMTTFRPD